MSQSQIALPFSQHTVEANIHFGRILRRDMRSLSPLGVENGWRSPRSPTQMPVTGSGQDVAMHRSWQCEDGKQRDRQASFTAFLMWAAPTPLPALDWTLNCHIIDLTLFKFIFHLGAGRSHSSPRYTKRYVEAAVC